MTDPRYPIHDDELPEYLQRLAEDDHAPRVWSPRRRALLLITASVGAWTILLLAAIGLGALFGVDA